MKIISYNVNGIRAAINKGFLDWAKNSQADIICLQETKVLKEQLDLDGFALSGYPYNYWFSAEKKGYSGVAILSKKEPKHVECGTGIPYMDTEGRNIRIDFDDVSLMSLYLPSGTNENRLEFKLKYMDDFLLYIKALKKSIPNLIISGDYNICHQAIDIHNPVKNANVSGFLSVEREWLTKFLGQGFIDTFRDFNSNPHNYSWWSYRANARNNNKGWRIDYHMATKSVKDRLKSASILPNVKHSDHCPIVVELD